MGRDTTTGDTTRVTTGDVASQGLKQAVQTEAFYRGLGEIPVYTKPISPLFKFIAGKAPIIGAGMSGTESVLEIKQNISDGKYGKAGIASIAGLFETAGNLFGFGVGDSARELIRSAAIKAAGENYAIEKSSLRTASETFGQAAAMAVADETPKTLTNAGILPYKDRVKEALSEAGMLANNDPAGICNSPNKKGPSV